MSIQDALKKFLECVLNVFFGFTLKITPQAYTRLTLLYFGVGKLAYALKIQRKKTSVHEHFLGFNALVSAQHSCTLFSVELQSVRNSNTK